MGLRGLQQLELLPQTSEGLRSKEAFPRKKAGVARGTR